jgi:DNA-binding beta-propeller fold protein YncE
MTLGVTALSLFNTTVARGATVERAWESRYEGISNGEDVPRAIALSADGTRVFVTGLSLAGRYIYDGARADYATVGYDTATGGELWASRYDGPSSRWDAANGIAVSPDGGRVFVTGGSRDETRDYETLAYDSVTGSEIWSVRYDGRHHMLDSAQSVDVSPDGSTVFVTGYSIKGFTPRGDRIMQFLTIAYDAETGSRKWIARYDGAGVHNYAFEVVVAPDGGLVFVTGWGDGGNDGPNAEIVCYDASSGAERWATRHNGPRPGGEAAYAIAVAPDGATLFATGTSGTGFGTLALDTQTGAVEWSARFVHGGYSSADSIAVSPDGSRVYVAGWSDRAGSGQDLAAVAYNANDGTRVWTSRQAGAGGESVTVVVSPGGRRVYLTGAGSRPRSGKDYVSVAFRAEGGSREWVRYYDGGVGKQDEANVAVAAPRGRLYVSGDSADADGRDYATIAYAPA